MFLAELAKISRRGAHMPVAFWLPEYYRIRDGVLAAADAISQQLHSTHIAEEWKNSVDVFRGEPVSEFAVAKACRALIDLLQSSPAAASVESLLESCNRDTALFFRLSQKTVIFEDKRATLKKSLSSNEQHAYDVRLFSGEGMNYCLEYYLEIYKRLTDAQTAEQQQALVEPKEIALGFGKVPGLRQDFLQYEVLEKFIYLILEDGIRNALARAYFETRSDIVRTDIPMPELIGSLHRLIITMFTCFHVMGIDRLTSQFFKPYGEQTLLQDIRL